MCDLGQWEGLGGRNAQFHLDDLGCDGHHNFSILVLVVIPKIVEAIVEDSKLFRAYLKCFLRASIYQGPT